MRQEWQTLTADFGEGYVIKFRPTQTDWFYTTVLFKDCFVAEKSCCRDWSKAIAWARKEVVKHKQAMTELGLPL